MKFVYTPEGAEKSYEWPWAPFDMPSPDAIEIEKLTGMRFRVWADEVVQGSMLATQAFLYLMLRKETPGLQWDQVRFSYSECKIVLSDDEVISRLADLERLARANDLSEQEGRMLGALRASVPSDVQLRIAADLDAEEAEAAEADEAEDPSSTPSEPESAPGAEKPAKPTRKKS